MTGKLSGRTKEGLGWGNTEKRGGKEAKRGPLPQLPYNSLSTSTGRWPIMAARCRAEYPAKGQPAEPSGVREPQRNAENAASPGLTAQPASLRFAANHCTHLIDRLENRPIDTTSPAPYEEESGKLDRESATKAKGGHCACAVGWPLPAACGATLSACAEGGADGRPATAHVF